MSLVNMKTALSAKMRNYRHTRANAHVIHRKQSMLVHCKVQIINVIHYQVYELLAREKQIWVTHSMQIH